MPNRYSNFPDMIDDIKRLSEVQEMTAEHKIKVARYTELALKNMTVNEESEFENLKTELKDFQLNSSDWNKLVEAIYNLHRYFKEVVLNDLDTFYTNTVDTINDMVDGIQIPLNNAKGEIETTKNLAVIDMNSKVERLIDSGQIGFRFYDASHTVQAETNKITIPISEFNKNIDYLMIHVNGALIRENVNYTLSTNGYTMTSVGMNWEVGTVFDFLVIKRTMVLNDRYDTALFEDGTIPKNKLEQALQTEITNSTNNKQNITESTLTTTAKKIPLAINEINGITNDNKRTLGMIGKRNGIATLNDDGFLVESQRYRVGDIIHGAKAPSEDWLLCDGGFRDASSYSGLLNSLGDGVVRDITKGNTVTQNFSYPSGHTSSKYVNWAEFFKGYAFFELSNSIYRSTSATSLTTLVNDTLPSGYTCIASLVNFNEIAICRCFYKIDSGITQLYLGYKTEPSSSWTLLKIKEQSGTSNISLQSTKEYLIVMTDTNVMALSWELNKFVIKQDAIKDSLNYVFANGFFWGFSVEGTAKLIIKRGTNLASMTDSYSMTTTYFSYSGLTLINGDIIIKSVREVDSSYLDFYSFDTETLLFSKTYPTSLNGNLWWATSSMKSIELSKDTIITFFVEYGSCYYSMSPKPFSTSAVWYRDSSIATFGGSNYVTRLAFNWATRRLHAFGQVTGVSTHYGYYIPFTTGMFKLPKYDFGYIKYK